MPEARIYTANFNWPLVRKASNPSDVWDWFTEYTNLWSAVDTTVNNVSTVANSASSAVTTLQTLETNRAAATKEFTGFTNNSDIVVSYSELSRTITLSGTFQMYHKGVKVLDVEADTWTSEAHASGLLTPIFLKYNDSGFSWALSWEFWEVQIAVVYFSSNGDFQLAAREVHGFMPWQTHRHLHKSVGTFRCDGGTVAYSAFSSTTATDRRPTITECNILDEDLPTTLAAHTSQTSYTQLYLADANGRLVITKSQAEIVALSGTAPLWNQWTGTTWQQTALPVGSYMCVWLVATTASADASSQLARYIWVAGQRTGTLTEMQQLTPGSLNTGALSVGITEFVFIEKTIIYKSPTNWYPVESERLSITKGGATSSAAGYLTSVYHDYTISGAGTASSPLSLNNAYTQTELYVSTTGNDTTGNGTETLPFATVEKALSYVPPILKTRYNIWIENGTYSSFPAHIKRECVGDGRLMIARNEAPVDVLAGPYTVSAVEYSDGGSDVVLSVSGSPFTEDALRSSVGSTVQVRMLTGNAAGHIIPVYRNTTGSLICLASAYAIEVGDTFKIIEPGVIFSTATRHIFDIGGNREKAIFILDGLAFQSSFYEGSTLSAIPAYEGIGSANCSFLNCSFRSQTDKAHTLGWGSSGLNSDVPISLADIPYYNDISGNLPYGEEFFHLHQTCQANAISSGTSGTTFAQHVGPFVANGTYGVSPYRSGSSVWGLCTRNILYLEARMAQVVKSAAGLVLSQYGIAYINSLSTYSWETYSVKAERASQLTLYGLQTRHTSAKNATIYLDVMAQMPICEGIYQTVADNYIIRLGFNCKAEITDAISAHGSIADIYFNRGQKTESFPAEGYSVNDGESSYVSRYGSVSGATNPTPLLPMGVSVESIETDAPSTPTVGNWYLIQGGAGSYEKQVIYRKNSTQWEAYVAYDGAEVFDKDTSRYYRYDATLGRAKWSCEFFHQEINIKGWVAQEVLNNGANYAYGYSFDADLLGASNEVCQFEMLVRGTVQGESRQWNARVYGSVAYPDGTDFGGYEQSTIVDNDSITTIAEVSSIAIQVRQRGSAQATFPLCFQVRFLVDCGSTPTPFDIDWYFELKGIRKTGVGNFC